MENIDPKKLYRIVIDEQAGVDGSETCVVGLNGKLYQIARNHEVVVSGAVVKVLRDAVYDKYRYNKDTGEIIKYQVPRFPVRILGEAKPVEKSINQKKIREE